MKIGRTQLMDATPVRLGQEGSGYAQPVAYDNERAQTSIEPLRELALAEPAVGTGSNRSAIFQKKCCGLLKTTYSVAFYEAKKPL